MRLIDADKLVELFTPYVSEDKKVIYQPRQIKMDDIKNAPTVKAITVEWIEKYLEPYKEHFNKLSDKAKETSGAGWVIDVLESMLREWEKENEK